MSFISLLFLRLVVLRLRVCLCECGELFLPLRTQSLFTFFFCYGRSTNTTECRLTLSRCFWLAIKRKPEILMSGRRDSEAEICTRRSFTLWVSFGWSGVALLGQTPIFMIFHLASQSSDVRRNCRRIFQLRSRHGKMEIREVSSFDHVYTHRRSAARLCAWRRQKEPFVDRLSGETWFENDDHKWRWRWCKLCKLKAGEWAASSADRSCFHPAKSSFASLDLKFGGEEVALFKAGTGRRGCLLVLECETSTEILNVAKNRIIKQHLTTMGTSDV